MNYEKTGGHTITGAIKPATRPRYNSNSHNEAIRAAARISTRHGCPMYVSPNYYGWLVSWKEPEMVEVFFKVEGREVEFYESEGRIRIRGMTDEA